jgi:hypothetical protein
LVEVASAGQREALLPHLDRAGSECVGWERLEHLDPLLDTMAQHLSGKGTLPSMLDVPGMVPAQVGRFQVAAAEFYRHKPWQHSTGPKTPEGKTGVGLNGRYRQAGPISEAEIQRKLAEVNQIIASMTACRTMIAGNRSAAPGTSHMVTLSQGRKQKPKNIEAAKQYISHQSVPLVQD